MASDLIANATHETWQDEVLAAEQPVLVDFWATWCGPCKAIAPLLEGLAKEKEGSLKIVKLSLDDQQNMRIASQYGVTNIPTLVVFKGGKEVGRKVGAGGGVAALRNLVQNHL